ncbi:uncharacterized protein PITG_22037 [Phytophthora infestans T30-4]|uniref:Uncharacterized protein n=1 Tax=Phytophthora infestans (strain T30-4) TaxID=403677 RepID=D0RLT9_PHYIT|nr:uncharacterized protein PITG_22037 [Phytophthora infestans T30-4]EEY70248.1 hypothetical protein PITG_22037 [Phytophthora infestans T30-4]|eukprot:XP_002999323.1 hypothetical protein PITG_22037 [Phytophthora infestans T30-4]
MVNKRWSAEEEYALLDYLSTHLDEYTKGVKSKFYEAALTVLPQKSATQVKTKCTDLESTNKSYKTKLSRSGFGLKTTDPTSIKDMLLKKCKYFYEMDEIFGSRHNMVPPFVLEPNAAVLNGQVYTRSNTTVTTQTPAMVSTPTVSTSPSPAVAIASIVSSPPTPAAAAVISTPAAADSSTPALAPGESMNVSEYFPANSLLTIRSPTAKISSKRVYNDSPGSSIAKLLAQIRDERDTTRAERHNEEMLMRREELELKRHQFEAYKLELKLKEQKMERMFSVMTQKLDLQAKKMEIELLKLRTTSTQDE